MFGSEFTEEDETSILEIVMIALNMDGMREVIAEHMDLS